MRKKTIKCLCDSIFWSIVYLLPLIIMALSVYRTGSIVSITSAMSTLGVTIFENNVIYTSLIEIFGSAGIFPLFMQTDIFMFLTYFISAYLLHIVIDILLFIPRFAMNLADNFGNRTGAND